MNSFIVIMITLILGTQAQAQGISCRSAGNPNLVLILLTGFTFSMGFMIKQAQLRFSALASSGFNKTRSK